MPLCGDGARENNGSSEDWDSRATAFLAKLRDREEASKHGRISSSHHTSSSSSSSTAPFVYSGAPVASRPEGYEGAKSSTDFGSRRERKRKRKKESIGDEKDSSSRAAATATLPLPPIDNFETTKRKLLGVLMLMQRETDSGKELSNDDVDRIYEEVGLSPTQREVSQMVLSEMMNEMIGLGPASKKKPTINLQDYGIDASCASSSRNGKQDYGSHLGGGRDNYGGSPRVAQLAGMDAEAHEILNSLRGTLKQMKSRRNDGTSPLNIPMSPGNGRSEYDSREVYPPPSTAFPHFRSLADANALLNRSDPLDAHVRMDPRDSRESHAPPHQRADWSFRTREEYEARLRGGISRDQPGSAPKPPTAATTKQPEVEVITLSDDDDELDQKSPTAAAATPAASRRQPLLFTPPLTASVADAAAAPAARRQPLMPTPPPTAAADAAPAAGATMTAEEWMISKRNYAIGRVRQQWWVVNRAVPTPQPHLQQLQHPAAVSSPTPAAQSLQQAGSMGGQWNASYYPPLQQMQRDYYDKNGGGYNTNNGAGGGYH